MVLRWFWIRATNFRQSAQIDRLHPDEQHSRIGAISSLRDGRHSTSARHCVNSVH